MKMKWRQVLLISLILAVCLGCRNEANKKTIPKAKKIASFKPLIQNKLEEKEKLSSYGFFKPPLANLEPANQVVLYDLNSPLFSDYAFKKRFLYLPDSTKMNYKNKGVMGFENGSILIKNFYYPKDFRKPELEKRIIETRLLIKENDSWKPLTYIWNEEQTDATLNYIGKEELIHWIDDQGNKRSVSYAVPNLNQCKNCHINEKEITPIGPTAAQWNKPILMHSTIKINWITFMKKEF